MDSPTVVAMLMCDRVITDLRTRQRSLVGLTTSVYALRFPAMHPTLGLYIAIADAPAGRMACEVRLLEEGQTEPMVKAPGHLDVQAPAELVEMDLTLQGLQFPRPGRYALELWLDGKLAASRWLTLQEVKLQGGPQAPPPTPALPPPGSKDRDFTIRFDMPGGPTTTG